MEQTTDSLEPQVLRQILGEFATGVTVVTSCVEGMIHGLTVNSFCSVSLNPPLVLVCIDKTAQGCDVIKKGNCFAINILSEKQRNLSDRFANPKFSPNERFSGVKYFQKKTGAPIFENNLGWMDCKLVNNYDGGDHAIFVGEILSAANNSTNKPLLFFRSNYQVLNV